MVLSVFSVTVAFAGTGAAAQHTMSGIGLASDIPGPIEFRNTQTGTYQIVVAFDRNVTDAGNITFEIEGTTPDGGTLSVDRAATGGQVQLRNGSLASDAPGERNLQNSVAIITVGNAPNPDNNIVTDGTITVNYSAGGASFTEEFDLIATSASIDAGAPVKGTVYQGEQIAMYNLTSAHDEYELFLDDNFQKSGRSGQNTTVALEDTEDLDANVKYDIEFLNSSAPRRTLVTNTTLRIRNLGLTSELDEDDEDEKRFPETRSTSISATVSSNVAGRFVQVDLVNVTNDSVENTTFVNLRGGGADREADVKFEGVSPNGRSNYTVNVTDLETGIEASSEEIRIIPIDGEPEFTETLYTVTRGNEVEYTVDMNGLTQAFIWFGGQDVNYLSRFNVTDGGGPDGNTDGEVEIIVDTYEEGRYLNGTVDMAQDRDVRVADPDNDSISGYKLEFYREPDDALDVGSYSLNVSPTIEDQATGVSTVQITDRSTESARTWVAPAGKTINDEDDVADHATLSSESAKGDKFIVQVNATGLYSFFDEDYNLTVDESPPTPNSGNADYRTYGVGMRIRQTNAEINQQTAEIDPDNATLIVDEDASQIYVVIDSANNSLTSNPRGMRPGQRYRATFLLNGTYSDFLPNKQVQSVSTTFTVRERLVRWDQANRTEVVNVNQANTTISGTTTMAPGTELTIRAQSTTTGEPFLLTDPNITVQDDKSFSTNFDFSPYAGGTEFELTLRADAGPQITNREIEGLILGVPSASVTFSDQESTGESVVIDSVTMSRGGFVAIHEGDAGGPVIGSSKFLSAGTHENVRIALDEPVSEDVTLVAMPHLDTNDNNVYEFPDADGPYTADGAPVTDDAAITIRSGGTVVVTRTGDTPTPRVVTRTVQPDTPSPRERTVTRTVVRTQTPGQPGFGIAIAIVALLAAALLAVRRRS